MTRIKSVEEIDGMLKWLDVEIKEWESVQSEPDVGTDMDAPNCKSSGIEYAGLLARRAFLLSLRIKATGLIL